MNTPNPLQPQGSLLQAKGKPNVRIAVFTILAVHAVLLVGLLMQGCKRDNTPIAGNEETNSVPTLPPYTPSPTNDAAFAGNTNNDLSSAPPPLIPTNSPMPPTQSETLPGVSTSQTAISQLPTGQAPEQTGREYTVVRGDTLAVIARKNGVTVRAIERANPGIVPTKLKVGQKLMVPAATASATAQNGLPGNNGGNNGSPATASNGRSDATVYVVKTGDTLTKISKAHNVPAKAIRAANNLKTDRINVGQKLKIPTGSNRNTASNGAAPTATESFQNPPAGNVTTSSIPQVR